MDTILVLHGNILFSKNSKELSIHKNSYLVSINGLIDGIYSEIPTHLKDYNLKDYGNKIIIPGMTDLHIHAPQYVFQGVGMDLELLDWLNTYTFPEESKYSSLSYAHKAYTNFVEKLRKSTTTRACIFATIHADSTLLLMDMLEKSGLSTLVGKVNMDRNSPDTLKEESADIACFNTEKFLLRVLDKNYKNTKAILTPRFIPSCSDELMTKLQNLKDKYDLCVQSHLSENLSEIAWVQELCPWSQFYGDAYDKFNMFGRNTKTIMAHCVHSPIIEIDRMKENGVFIAHCPESNINLSSGIAPIRTFLDKDMNIGLGSDVAAGTTLNIFKSIAYSIQASKMRWRLQDNSLSPLTVAEGFYLATKGGGEFFGKVGSFDKDYEADIIILDDTRINHNEITSLEKRLERMIYLADEREVFAKYVKGSQLF